MFNTPVANTQMSVTAFKDFGDAVERFFVQNPKKIKPNARQLFQYVSMGNNKGTEKIMKEYDGKTFANTKPEGVRVRKTKAGLGYSKLFRLKRFGTEIDITYEMDMFGKDPEVKRNLISLSNFCTHRQELDLTHVFSFAGSVSMVNMDGDVRDMSVGDGNPLVFPTHTLANSSLTYSNNLTGNPVFSQANLEAAEIMASAEVLSNFGEKREFDFNTIVTSDHSPVVNEVKRVLQATADISAPNAGVPNVYQAKYRHVILPYMATTATGARDSFKKNYWFLIAAGEWNGYLVEWEAERMVRPEAGNNMIDGHADTVSFGTRCGYDSGAISGKGLIGSLNAS
jgi:hypothetical protein